MIRHAEPFMTQFPDVLCSNASLVGRIKRHAEAVHDAISRRALQQCFICWENKKTCQAVHDAISRRASQQCFVLQTCKRPDKWDAYYWSKWFGSNNKKGYSEYSKYAKYHSSLLYKKNTAKEYYSKYGKKKDWHGCPQIPAVSPGKQESKSQNGALSARQNILGQGECFNLTSSGEEEEKGSIDSLSLPCG
eukprot:1157613-Pelagomonas_calceolata.AAC.4